MANNENIEINILLFSIKSIKSRAAFRNFIMNPVFNFMFSLIKF